MIQPLAIPLPFDRARAERTLAALGEGGFTPPESALPAFEAAFGNSPFLARLALRERDFLRATSGQDAHNILGRIELDVLTAVDAPDEASAMAILRRAKRQAALTIALADIGGVWKLGDVTRALSRFADMSISASLRFLLKAAAEKAQMDASDPAKLEAETGLIVLAMGKYGAFELNYSSDVDLITFYDPRRFPFRKKDDARGAAVDIVKGLVQLPRLRPPPTATSSASICACGQMRARRRSRSPPTRPRPITKAWARTGNAPR